MFKKQLLSDRYVIHKQAYWAYLSFHLVVYPTKMINQVLLLSNNIGVIWIEVVAIFYEEIHLYLLCHLHIYPGVVGKFIVDVYHTTNLIRFGQPDVESSPSTRYSTYPVHSISSKPSTACFSISSCTTAFACHREWAEEC